MSKQENSPAALPDEVVQELDAIAQSATHAIDEAQDASALEAARVLTLGMKGSVTRLFERIPTLDKSLRRAFGQRANALRAQIEAHHAARKSALEREALERELSGPKIDVTLPGRRAALGHRHPVSRTLDDIAAIFLKLGFLTCYPSPFATSPNTAPEHFSLSSKKTQVPVPPTGSFFSRLHAFAHKTPSA